MNARIVTIILLQAIAYNLQSQPLFPSEKLQSILNKTTDGKYIFGATVQINRSDSTWSGASGNMQTGSSYFIASTTKIFITAILLKLRSENRISLDEKISKYLPDSIMKGLHVLNNRDYSDSITIRHLLSHTSGIPDYFQHKNENGTSLLEEISSGQDRFWSFTEAISMSKKMKPYFAPGETGKAHYSDTNFQLLGRIIEIITQMKIGAVMNEFIFVPLEMNSTYLFTDINDKNPVPLYFKKQTLLVPKAMTSFTSDGGLVSTASDCMIFIRAFFKGKLFPESYLPELKKWNRIFSPLESGTGLLRFKIAGYMTGGEGSIDLIGHSGLSGAFAWYCPQKDAYITGTVNQIHKPSTSYKMAIKLILSL
jgi:D-alanyl-D-alanine carboxypeptidase